MMSENLIYDEIEVDDFMRKWNTRLAHKYVPPTLSQYIV